MNDEDVCTSNYYVADEFWSKNKYIDNQGMTYLPWLRIGYWGMWDNEFK